MSYLSHMKLNDARRNGDYVGISEASKQLTDAFMQILEDTGRINGNKAVGYKNNPTTLSPQAPYIHGSGGLLSDPGQSPAMLSTFIRPMEGMASRLPRIDSGEIYPVDLDGREWGGEDVPLITTITGVTAGDLDTWSNQPNGLCDDPPVAGLLKACTQTAPFGRFSAKLRQLDRTRIGRLNNRGETTDFRVLNRLNTDDPLLPVEASQGMQGSWINDEIESRIFEAGAGFQRMVAPLVYTGTPTNNKAGGGARQFLGFNNIYISGRVDWFTQLACAAMDSFIVNFNTNIANPNIFGVYIYQELEDIHYFLGDLAEYTGLTPVTFAISMDKDLFYNLCQIIPVQQYVRVVTQMAVINTSNKDGGQLHFNGAEVNAMRDDMYNNRWLPLNGERVPVVVESGGTIGRTYNAATNTATSDIYIHPLTVLGGVPVTYWQFFNHDNSQGRDYDELFTGGNNWTTDGGKFLWARSFKNFCADIMWLTEPRIMSHAPQLGARIRNVSYTPNVMSRSPYPSDSSFFADGGRIQGNVLVGSPSWSPTSSQFVGVLN